MWGYVLDYFLVGKVTSFSLVSTLMLPGNQLTLLSVLLLKKH